MKSSAINRKEKLTPKEWKEVEKSLAEAGINKKDLANILGRLKGDIALCSTTDNCEHRHGCDGYAPPKNSIGELRDILKQKNIDIRTLDPAVRKILE